MGKSHASDWPTDSPSPDQIKEFFAQIADGKITKPSLQALLIGSMPLGELTQNSDGSIGFTKTVRGRSDEELVARVKAMGWNYINPAIRTERRIKVSGKPEIEIGAKRILTIEKVVPQGSTMKFKKAVAATRPMPLGFDLEDIVDMLEHCDELLALGVRWIIAPAARFAGGNGYECVVCANLEYRELYLFWVGFDWNDDGFFGSSKLAR